MQMLDLYVCCYCCCVFFLHRSLLAKNKKTTLRMKKKRKSPEWRAKYAHTWISVVRALYVRVWVFATCGRICSFFLFFLLFCSFLCKTIICLTPKPSIVKVAVGNRTGVLEGLSSERGARGWPRPKKKMKKKMGMTCAIVDGTRGFGCLGSPVGNNTSRNHTMYVAHWQTISAMHKLTGYIIELFYMLVIWKTAKLVKYLISHTTYVVRKCECENSGRGDFYFNFTFFLKQRRNQCIIYFMC